MNRKGNLVSIVISTMLVLTFFAFFSLIGSQAWHTTNQNFQSLSNDTVKDYVKQDIDDLTKYMTYTDKLFVFLFVSLIVAVMIVASTSNPQKPIWILLFIGTLVIITLLAMIFSNMWKFVLTSANWDVLQTFKITDFIMSFLPLITFLISVVSGIIFYSRRNKSSVIGGGDQFG